MTRIFKFYNLHFSGSGAAARRVATSSYPGVVGSTDNFFLTDSGLGIMETSLIILDPSAWNYVEDFDARPSVPNFAHILAVTRLATGGADWAERFVRRDTGTHASQWLIVDYNQFEQLRPARDNALWVVEAVPGLVHAEDMTAHLREHRYFPSFNRPFFGPIRQRSGHSRAEEEHGALYSWAHNPRAQIFASDAPNVRGPAGMRALMEQNRGGAGHAVAARLDLDAQLRLPNGGIDAKVVGVCLQRSLAVQALSGPSHATLQPFSWAGPGGVEAYPGWPHVGLPTTWNFDYVQLSPSGQGPVNDEVC